MSKLKMITRRRSLQALVTIPLLAQSTRSAFAVDSRHWLITGTRVEKLDGLDIAMARFMQQYGVRAGSVAVARQGHILFERAYTWAEPEYPVMQPTGPLRLASLSKIFTAAVIHELVQAKELDLNLHVFPWLGYDQAALPGQHVDPRLKTITLQHLLDHRAGWDSQAAQFDPIFSMRDIARKLHLHAGPARADIARFMTGEPLQFTPGTQEHYSNFGYLMLGLAAEKATGTEYFKLVKTRVLSALGIDGVFVAHTHRELRLKGEGFYDQPGTGLTPEYPDRDVRAPLSYGGEGWLTESMEPGGGLAASAGAIVRTIGHYAVWGLGLRRPRQSWVRSGSMAGTSSYAMSRPDGLDFCFIINTRNFGTASDAVGETAKEINRVLDASHS